MAGWRSELACCRSSLSMSKINVKISETKYLSIYKTLIFTVILVYSLYYLKAIIILHSEHIFNGWLETIWVWFAFAITVSILHGLNLFWTCFTILEQSIWTLHCNDGLALDPDCSTGIMMNFRRLLRRIRLKDSCVWGINFLKKDSTLYAVDKIFKILKLLAQSLLWM